MPYTPAPRHVGHSTAAESKGAALKAASQYVVIKAIEKCGYWPNAATKALLLPLGTFLLSLKNDVFLTPASIKKAAQKHCRVFEEYWTSPFMRSKLTASQLEHYAVKEGRTFHWRFNRNAVLSVILQCAGTDRIRTMLANFFVSLLEEQRVVKELRLGLAMEMTVG